MAGNSASKKTYYAPAERTDSETLKKERSVFVSNKIALSLLNAISDLAMVLNEQRQILVVNNVLVRSLGIEDPEKLIGVRPGELLQCVHSDEMPCGCGTSKACAECGAVHAILQGIDTRKPASGGCRISRKPDAGASALDVWVQATPITIGGKLFIVMDMRDISAEKRRQVLERVFFHDVLNIAGGIRAIAELMKNYPESIEDESVYKEDLYRMSGQIIEEIVAQRQLSAAERGDLQLNMTELSVRELIEEVVSAYRHHEVAQDRELLIGDVPDIKISSDATILKRILGNLVKNALEATPEFGKVIISAEDLGPEIAFHVKNPGVIPEEIQTQIFQRSFSTKGGSGRGVGTYSIKLFTERYLGGNVGFVSREPDGTKFTVELTKTPPKE